MKKITIVLSTALLLGAWGAEAQKNNKQTGTSDFKTTASGLQYKIVKDVPGTVTPKLGDQLELHITVLSGDTVLYESRKFNNNEPVQFNLMPPAFGGDISEGFMLLTPGDSALFRVSVDSLKKSGAQVPPMMKDGDFVDYRVQMVSVKTQEQVNKEKAEKAAAQVNIDEKLIQEYFKKNKIKAEKTASGLYYTISKKGEGPNAKTGQQVTVNYTGKTLNGETFDSNVDPAFSHVQPFSFGLGAGQVIKGWDEGLALLNKGAKATLYIPSGMAYGERSPSPKIPANSVLIFDVEVTDIQDPGAQAPNNDHNEHDGHQH